MGQRVAMIFRPQSPHLKWGFPGGSDSKVSACNVGDPGSIPGWGRSSGEGNGKPTPLQFYLEPISLDPLKLQIKKQRHYFANQGPSSQGYGFSRSHV